MEIRQLEAFSAVHATGSVTAAARLLERSQPVVSRQLQDLEHELGFTLFTRTRPQVTLTDKGRLFLDEVQAILAGLQQLESRSREIAGGVTHPIRIGASFSLACSLLPSALASMGDPAVVFERKLHLSVLPSSNIVQALVNGEIDAAFTSLPLELGRCRLHWSAQAACQVALPDTHALADAPVISPMQLACDMVITPSNASRMRHRLSTALLHPSRDKGQRQIVTSSTMSAIMMVRAGLGVALVDPCLVQHIRPEGVVYKPLDSYVPYLFGAITYGDRPVPEALQNIIDAVHEYAFKQIPQLTPGDETGVPVFANPLEAAQGAGNDARSVQAEADDAVT
ncbi:LysR family transcriptional regulator [Yanghanlia caeni]|uniref:LysR family transcriptional regulator n=1 Tax=Yanghanlia caeni TaxID=3064283 RepID=A0ABU1D2T4_9BURK|nr:LysR family transcriptional regulator [Alcaligenaceae bacterium LG-2]